MYEHNLKTMVQLLIDAEVIPESDSRKALKVLKRYFESRIAIIWQLDDVLECAEENHYAITEKDGKAILQTMLKNHDCTLGINWDTIADYIQQHIDKKD